MVFPPASAHYGRMEFHTLLILIAFVGLGAIGWLLVAMRGQLSESAVRRLLQTGAKVIDVRSPGEFTARHLAGAINQPYGDIVNHIGTIAPDRSAPVLVHCQSGGRSAIARRLLRRHGYTRVYNLGSLRRAQKLTGLPLLTGPGT